MNRDAVATLRKLNANCIEERDARVGVSGRSIVRIRECVGER